MIGENHRLNFEGSRIHFLTVGDRGKPPLFLVHSFYLYGSVFKPYVPELSQHFFLVVPDLPGHGESERLTTLNDCANFARVLEAIRQELNLGKISLFGFSAGGVVVLSFATAFPKSAVAISVQGAPYFHRDYDIILRDKIVLWLSVKFPHFPKILQWLARYRFVWKIIRAFYRNLDRTMTILGEARLEESIVKLSPQAAYEWGQSVIRVDLRSDLKKIVCPVQIIIGNRDPYLTTQSVYRMASRLRDARVDVLRGGDHELTIKERSRVLAKMTEFFHDL